MFVFRKPLLTATFLTLAFGIVGPGSRMASADIINFDAQAAGRGTEFTGNLDSPLVIDIATFTGGELLNNEAGGDDETGVYGTISPNLHSGSYTNPLTISFSTPVSGFSIEVVNVFPDSFTVSDNLGGSSTLSVTASTPVVFTLPDSGITSVTISSAATRDQWDFAIDNVTFTPASVPEPSGILLGGIGAAAVLLYTAAHSRRMARKA